MNAPDHPMVSMLERTGHPEAQADAITCPICDADDFEEIFIGPSGVMVGCDACVAVINRTEVETHD